jgi:poly-gamma-glutamate synthesis protein (capsule biosynthesis protein)
MSNVGADTGKKYSFRFDTEAAIGLEFAGFDVLSLANNHALDWGRDSLCETTKNLDAVGIGYVGAGCNAEQAHAPYIAQLGETSVAFLAYTTFYEGAHATETRAGMTELDRGKMKTQIKMLKESGIDVVLLSMHWGTEYNTRSSKSQQDFAHELIDAGLDVLIGHHPHVAQEIERYNNGWVIYSLGNLVFDQYFSEETMQGLLADIQIQNGRVKDIQPKRIQLNSDYQPEIVKKN